MTKKEMCEVLKKKNLYERVRKFLHQSMTNCTNDDGGAGELLWHGVPVGYKDYTKKDLEQELWNLYKDENERDILLCLEHIELSEDYK